MPLSSDFARTAPSSCGAPQRSCISWSRKGSKLNSHCNNRLTRIILSSIVVCESFNTSYVSQSLTFAVSCCFCTITTLSTLYVYFCEIHIVLVSPEREQYMYWYSWDNMFLPVPWLSYSLSGNLSVLATTTSIIIHPPPTVPMYILSHHYILICRYNLSCLVVT